MTKFILRVDDVGQAPEQHKPDRGLEYFRSWWDAGGWGLEPIYLGVVPAELTAKETQFLLDLERNTKAELCIHGWDHAKQVLTPDHVAKASQFLLRARAVIPPYNMYDEATIRATAKLWNNGMPVLFGGFHEMNAAGREADHSYGYAPVMLPGDVLHLSADRRYYEHCYRMVEAVLSAPDPGHPVVICIHHRWDVDFFGGVKALREALEGKLVTVEEALS